MVKENAALTAAAKVSSDYSIAARKGAANHALAAKLAIEQAQDMIGVSYTTGERLFEPPDGARSPPKIVLHHKR